MEKTKLAGYDVLPVLIGLMLMCCVLASHAQTNSSGKAVVAKLKAAKDRDLPYGLKTVASGFARKMDAGSLSKKLNDLNRDLYDDYDDPRRIKLRISQPLHRLWLKSGAHAYKFIKDYPGTMEFRALRLSKGARFELYSLMAYQELDCNNCEYGLIQAVNVLLTVTKGQIIDHMTGAFNSGNNLGYVHRYLYIDALKGIYTVDLVSDEEGAEARELQSWSINSSGHFIKK
jgi:hypothetical protein